MMIKNFLSNLNSKKVIWIIVLVGFGVYFNSLFNGFVWDDEEQIVNNAIIQSMSNLPQIFSCCALLKAMVKIQVSANSEVRILAPDLLIS